MPRLLSVSWRLVSSALLASAVAVCTGGTFAGAGLSVAGVSFEISAAGATDTAFAFTGTATVGSTPVLVFTASTLTLSGATLAGPCSPGAPAPASARETVSAAGTGTLSGSAVTLEVGKLDYTGLASPYTASSPPPSGSVLPLSLTGLDITAYSVNASSLAATGLMDVASMC